MSDTFNHEADAWDSLNDDLEPARYRAYGPPLVCNHCGSTDVFWQKVHNRKTEYAMYDINTLAEHHCLTKPCTPEGFDDV